MCFFLLSLMFYHSSPFYPFYYSFIRPVTHLFIHPFIQSYFRSFIFILYPFQVRSPFHRISYFKLQVCVSFFYHSCFITQVPSFLLSVLSTYLPEVFIIVQLLGVGAIKHGPFGDQTCNSKQQPSHLNTNSVQTAEIRKPKGE